MADDRLGGVSATTEATFSVVGTPAVLLRDAPAVTLPFRRDAILEPALLTAIVNSLRPPQPSPALTAALNSASERRFVDLLRGEPVRPEEEATRSDAARTRPLCPWGHVDGYRAAAAAGRAVRGSNRLGPMCCWVRRNALEGRDRDALIAWDAAVAAGLDSGRLEPDR